MQDLFAPTAGAILCVWMPESEHVCVPGPKFRPVLLLDRARQEDGTLEVLVAYGTSQQTNCQGRADFVLRSAEAKFLHHDTKFRLEKRMWLPVTQAFFTNNGHVQILGSVPPTALRRLLIAAKEAGIV